MSKRILIVATSHARMGDTGTATGVWVEELAAPYYRFVDAGLEATVASPQGGAVPLEPKSLKPSRENEPATERFLADPAARAATEASLRLADVDAADYDAIFLPGGHGTMWDLPVDASVKAAVEAAEAAGKVIAAVCHGPAGLLSAQRPDGQPLVAGRRVTGFTNAEEDAVGLSDVVPFLLETRLRDLGGEFHAGPDWQPFAVRDDRLITGQNPASSEAVAEHVLEALGGG